MKDEIGRWSLVVGRRWGLGIGNWDLTFCPLSLILYSSNKLATGTLKPGSTSSPVRVSASVNSRRSVRER